MHVPDWHLVTNKWLSASDTKQLHTGRFWSFFFVFIVFIKIVRCDFMILYYTMMIQRDGTWVRWPWKLVYFCSIRQHCATMQLCDALLVLRQIQSIAYNRISIGASPVTLARNNMLRGNISVKCSMFCYSEVKKNALFIKRERNKSNSILLWTCFCLNHSHKRSILSMNVRNAVCTRPKVPALQLRRNLNFRFSFFSHACLKWMAEQVKLLAQCICYLQNPCYDHSNVPID